ncbi:J domain-containing protein [Candidatus Contubernalis alkaliaceticus]|uniref:J domain-containing protein n=1 Tax=Candidatus Contubernalis alkaliaceticus TaxID=338645 RepID=UPI001F4C336D|nr:J domain-containing protein [Candidatus Contubernalis alkalaceticus]UNC92978.1 J domain-containing protein [Candidatus Contubernalis alkalaceticus]
MNKSKYEKKLDRIMKNLKINKYDYNWDRYGSWIQFHYKEDLYRLEHNIEKARIQGIIIHYGSEAFAQIVLALEDLYKVINRGIYNLDTWLSGMRLPSEINNTNEYYELLGFTQKPSSVNEIWEQYHKRIKNLDLDNNGTKPAAEALKEAAERAVEQLTGHAQ